MQLGNIAYRNGDKALAVQHYQVAAQHAQTKAAANYNLGRVAYEQKQYEQALGHLDQALELKVEHPLVLVYRARTLLALNRESEAQQDLEKASTRSSQQAEAYLELAKLLYSQSQRKDNTDAKREHLTKAVEKIQVARTSRSLTEEATLLSAAWRRELGNLPLAIAELEALIATHSYRIETHFTLAQYLLENQEFAEAERRFRNGLKMDPTNANGILGLGQALAGRSKIEEATRMYDVVIQSGPADQPLIIKAKELRDKLNSKLPESGQQ